MLSLVLLAGLSTVTSASPPPPQTPTFPAGTSVIRLDVSVVDKRGRPVPGLTPADFEVKENGRAVALTYFEAVSGGPPPPAQTPAVGERALPSSAARRILLLVDAGSMGLGALRRARQAVSAYVLEAQEGDWLRLVNLGTGETWDGEIPAQRHRLLAAARALQHRPSLWARNLAGADPIVERTDAAPERGLPSSAETSGQFLSQFAQSAGLLGTLEALLTELEGVPGRKALVFISSGFPQMRGLDRRLQRVASLARQGATTVYFVDATGQDGLIPEPGRRLAPAFETAWLRSGGAQDLAEATGGFTSRFHGSLLPALRNAAAEMRTYYVVGYAPPAGEGRFRRVAVKVKVPGLSARTKKGYLAPR
ncbi:MAG TPA: VWA domain-containing protein [Vicinamibacteria bacterium]|nr:VWA domain-containing protein [Vicinamibacteria bacterium]